MTVEQEIKKLFANKEVYLYGAGKIGRCVAGYLQRMGINVKGVIVSNITENNPINGLPLYDIHAFSLPDGAYIALAVGKKLYLEVLNLLVEQGFHNVIQIPDRCKAWMSQKQLEYAYACQAAGYQISYTEAYSEAGMGIIFDEKKQPLFRVIEYSSEEQAGQLSNVCTREYFESQYGELRTLPAYRILSEKNDECKDIEIYVATSHLDKMMDVKRDGLFIPIQVGAAMTTIRKGCQTDDEGENLSLENANYCECTGLYWVWKNTSGQEYVGLNHYRRRLNVSAQDIRVLREQNCGMLLALPQYGSMKVKEFFAGRLITETDWNLMMKYIVSYDESFKSVVEKYEDTDIYISCNLMLAKRVWFDKYCEFAFTIAEKIDQYYKERGIIRNDRYMGYIFENLLSIFVMRYHEDIRAMYTTVKWIA